MRAEVIAIGDELTSGQRLDTNSQWLSERLTELGVQVAFHTTIGDALNDNIAAFQAAIQRADVVVSTGGLGPTADDLTREAMAADTGAKLVRDATSLAHIRQLFERRGRTMPEHNVVQADFPAGSQPIPNPNGTAPGIAMSVERAGRGDCLLFALPGVPVEMHAMWEATVAPAVATAQPEPRVIRHRRIKCFGVGESHLEAMLPDLIRRGREPSVGITVSDATITLRITAAGRDEASCYAAMEPTVATIREALGTLVFGEEDDELEDVVARLLAARRQTVAVAEWATDGLVTQWLATAEESALAAGVTITDSRQLQQILPAQLPATEIAAHESATASAMAEAVRNAAQANFGLGIAAFPPQRDQADARVCASLATADRTHRWRFGCSAHPAIVRSRTAKQALNALRLLLLERDG